MDTPIQLIVGQTVIFLTTVVGLIVTLIKDRRAREAHILDRKHDEEQRVLDRRLALEEIVLTAEAKARALAIEVESKANALKMEAQLLADGLRRDAQEERHIAQQERMTLHAAIAEVKQETQLTKLEARAANKEANHAALKMNQLVSMFNAVQSKSMADGTIAAQVNTALVAAAEIQTEQLAQVHETSEDTSERVKDIQAHVVKKDKG